MPVVRRVFAPRLNLRPPRPFALAKQPRTRGSFCFQMEISLVELVNRPNDYVHIIFYRLYTLHTLHSTDSGNRGVVSSQRITEECNSILDRFFFFFFKLSRV